MAIPLAHTAVLPINRHWNKDNFNSFNLTVMTQENSFKIKAHACTAHPVTVPYSSTKSRHSSTSQSANAKKGSRTMLSSNLTQMTQGIDSQPNAHRWLYIPKSRTTKWEGQKKLKIMSINHWESIYTDRIKILKGEQRTFVQVTGHWIQQSQCLFRIMDFVNISNFIFVHLLNNRFFSFLKWTCLWDFLK